MDKMDAYNHLLLGKAVSLYWDGIDRATKVGAFMGLPEEEQEMWFSRAQRELLEGNA